MKRYLPFFMLLTACNGNLSGIQIPNPGLVKPSVSPTSNPTSIPGALPGSPTLFGNAIQKRTLALDQFARSTSGTAQSSNAAEASTSGPQKASQTSMGAAAPQAIGAPAMAPQPGIAPRAGMASDAKMAGPWYGGGEFNNFVLQFAEESSFAASKAKTLLTAYSQTVKPLLSQWDASARLIESQANLGSGQNLNNPGLFYLPDEKGNPVQLKVNYLFRFASTSRKETLVIYLTDTDTRVHRLVWGEANLDLSRIKLDSTQAQDIARKALTSRSKSDYPVYPDQSYPGQSVLYEIPANARWQVSLNQNNGVSRYFVSVSFEPANQKNQQTASGSVEIDALTGKIQSLNRPVLYNEFDKGPYPAPPVMVAPANPDQPVSSPPTPVPVAPQPSQTATP